MYHFYIHKYFWCGQESIYNGFSSPAEHCNVVHFSKASKQNKNKLIKQEYTFLGFFFQVGFSEGNHTSSLLIFKMTVLMCKIDQNLYGRETF